MPYAYLLVTYLAVVHSDYEWQLQHSSTISLNATNADSKVWTKIANAFYSVPPTSVSTVHLPIVFSLKTTFSC